jgi:hypothetical protein
VREVWGRIELGRRHRGRLGQRVVGCRRLVERRRVIEWCGRGLVIRGNRFLRWHGRWLVVRNGRVGQFVEFVGRELVRDGAHRK